MTSALKGKLHCLIVIGTEGGWTAKSRGRRLISPRRNSSQKSMSLMVTSLGGRIRPNRWTLSPDGGRQAWTTNYAVVHAILAGVPSPPLSAGVRHSLVSVTRDLQL